MRLSVTRRLPALVAGLLAVVPMLVAPSAHAAPPAVAERDPSAQVVGWSPTGSMSVKRERAAGVLLNDGRAMVMGGRDCGAVSCTDFASSEFYNPGTGTWSPGPSMSSARTDFEAVVLGNGKVLAIGGAAGSGNQTADLYDPATNTFSSAGSFSVAMDSGFAAVVLASGKVLVVGGCCGGAPYNDVTVIYNPATNTWSNGPLLPTQSYAPTATLLPNGKVLVAGGISSGGTVLATSYLYDPVSNTFGPGPTLFDARWSGLAGPLPDGKVLLAAGVGPSGCFGASEVYTPATNSVGNHRTGLPPRTDQTANPVLTNNGKLLLAGGNCNLQTAGLYNFGTGTWQGTPNLTAGRRDHVLLRLRDGTVIAAGGDNFSTSLASAERYTSQTTATAYATPNPVRRGSPVTIAGSGFAPNEMVQLSNNGVVFATATANASGAFSAVVGTSGFPARTYIDRARGLSSGRSAYFAAPVVTA